jgi:hypothetical protein
MKRGVYKINVDTREGLFPRTVSATASINKPKISPDEPQAIFTHELQSALRLTEAFSNIYCELKNLSFLYNKFVM